MTRTVLCIHPDDDVLAALRHGSTAEDHTVASATSLADATRAHARRPAEVVVTDVDDEAAVVRSLLRWHPTPEVVTVGPVARAELSLASGASEHVETDSAPDRLGRAVDRTWHRHRARRTRRAGLPAAGDLPDLRERVSQVVALTTAAHDLLTVEAAPHPAARSLLDQAAQVGRRVIDLVGEQVEVEPRVRLDLATLLEAAWQRRGAVALVEAAWGRHTTVPLELDIDPVVVHGHAGMLRTALDVLTNHTLRAPAATTRALADLEVLDWAVRLRVHEDGPAVSPRDRQALFTGGDGDQEPSLLAVHHVATRHGGAAWLADSDRIEGGTMGVVELPRRTRDR